MPNSSVPLVLGLHSSSWWSSCMYFHLLSRRIWSIVLYIVSPTPKSSTCSFRSPITLMKKLGGVWRSLILRSNSKMLGQKALMLGPWWLSIQEIRLGRFVPTIYPLSLKNISACLDFLFPMHTILFIIDVIT